MSITWTKFEEPVRMGGAATPQLRYSKDSKRALLNKVLADAMGFKKGDRYDVFVSADQCFLGISKNDSGTYKVGTDSAGIAVRAVALALSKLNLKGPKVYCPIDMKIEKTAGAVCAFRIAGTAREREPLPVQNRRATGF